MTGLSNAVTRLHPNHAFLLEVARSHGGRILDYGCGNGEVVTAGLDLGLDIYGAENFSCLIGDCPGTPRSALGDRLFEVDAGNHISCPSSYFDLVVSNQVLEHVADLESLLVEMHRVLKPNGTMLHIFPTREVWREGHCRVPFAHRVKNVRRWLRLAHRLGLGLERDDLPSEQWAAHWQDWLRQKCFYRTLPEISAAFSAAGFSIERAECPLMLYRAKGRGVYLPIRLFPSLASWAYEKLAGVVINCAPLPQHAVLRN